MTIEHQIIDELLQGKQLMKLTKSQNIVFLYHLKDILSEDTSVNVSDCVQPLLQDYAKIFETPKSLPLFRVTDHQIHLKPEVASINVRPHRYPYFQKSKMEKLVQEML